MAILTGTVSEFSDERGLGTIRSTSGREFVFHVIEIADGTRSIEVDCPVTFRTLPKFGSIQAASVTKV